MPNTSINGAVVPVFGSYDTDIHGLGAKAETADGRKFRWVKAGASDLVVGNVLQAEVEDTDHDDITCRATAAGVVEVLITTGATNGALDANEYAGGYLVVDTTPGLGYIHKISHHAAIAASTNGSIFLMPEDPIQVALTASSKVTLVKSPYQDVIQAPATTLTGVPVGVAVYPITAAEYGWIQTSGPCGVLVGGTPGAGLSVATPGNTAGEVVIDPADGAATVIGRMMVTGRDGKVQPVFLSIE